MENIVENDSHRRLVSVRLHFKTKQHDCVVKIAYKSRIAIFSASSGSILI